MPTSPFDALFNQGRDLFREQLCDAIAAQLAAADASLTELADKATDEEAKKRITEGRDAALPFLDAIAEQFRARYPAEFQKQTHAAKGVAPSLSSISLDDLQLVEEDDLNETLKLNDAAAKLRRKCEDELSALDQRVGVLLGDAGLEADDDPFGPKTLLATFKLACRHSECPLEGRMALLLLFEGANATGIQEAYQKVNDLLVENGILPKIRYGISKTEDKGSARAAGDEAKPAEAEKPPEDLFAALAKAMAPAGAGAGAGGAPGMGVGGVPLVQGPELMSSLTQLQVGDLSALGEAAAELGPILAEAGNLKNILHQLKQTSVGGSMGQVDAMTLDIVAMLFDELFEDDKIPVALKSLIGRLQLPMLKVAIADKELFTQKSHPARQLLDTLGQIGLRLPPEFDEDSPLFGRLRTFIVELVDGFGEKMEIFDKVRADLEAIVAEDDRRVEEAMQATERELAQAESLSVAKAAAQEEIRTRVESGPRPPRGVLTFLMAEWIKYLVIVHAKEGPASDAWRIALETIDRLLWSIQPKTTPEERKRLTQTIPPLLKALKGGVVAAEVGPDEATAFFAELMKCHTDAINAQPAPPVKEKSRAAVAAGTAEPGVKVKAAKPAEPVEELDFSSPVVVNNPFGGGQLEVSAEDLDFTATVAEAAIASVAPAHAPATGAAPPAPAKGTASAAPAPRAKKPATSVHLPAGYIKGNWIHVMDEDGAGRRAARLHYVSPRKSHFLFVDRRGNKVFECSRTVLARKIKLGQVTLLEGEPEASLFDRILAGVFGKLNTPLPTA
jgi:hypothetical protein